MPQEVIDHVQYIAILQKRNPGLLFHDGNGTPLETIDEIDNLNMEQDQELVEENNINQEVEIEDNEELRGVLMRQQANLESSLKIIKTLHPRINSTQEEQNALKLI